MKNVLIVLFLFSLIINLGCKKFSKKNTILVVMADVDFYDPEYTIPLTALEKLGYSIQVANISGKTSVGIQKLKVKADLSIDEAKETDYQALLLVGGYGAAALYNNKDLIKLSQDFHKSKKIIGAQCFTPVILAQAEVLTKGHKATCWGSEASELMSYGVTYTGNKIEIQDTILTGMAGSKDNIIQFTNAYIKLLQRSDVAFQMENSSKEELPDWKDLANNNFESIHKKQKDDENKYLILGNIPIISPDNSVQDQLKNLSGRWEGYDLSPPVAKDTKIVFVIKEINNQKGKGVWFAATNLQYPDDLTEFEFMITNKDIPQIVINSDSGKIILKYHKQKNQLMGNMNNRKIILSKEKKDFNIFKNYTKYLNSKRIYVEDYHEKKLQQFGKGYMYYLPPGYKKHKNKKWPVIIFLHGSGDNGDNMLLLAKASPYMFIREKKDLPFIIAAPLLKPDILFPTKYIDDFITKINKQYNVDESRVYLTGLSIGGEATFRYAIAHPDRLAAIASLCGPLRYKRTPLFNSITYFEYVNQPLSNFNNMPIWAIIGDNDEYYSVELLKTVYQDIKKAGGNIKLTILKDHDHDVWTDTYSDINFYNWFLKH